LRGVDTKGQEVGFPYERGKLMHEVVFLRARVHSTSHRISQRDQFIISLLPKEHQHFDLKINAVTVLRYR
jgi:hypothetical protein